MSPSKDKNSPSTKFRFQAGSMWNCETSKITSKIILLLEALLHATLKGVNSDWTRLMGWSSRHEGEPSLTGPQFSGLLILLLEVAWRKKMQLKVLGCCKLEVFSLIPSHMFKLQVFPLKPQLSSKKAEQIYEPHLAVLHSFTFWSPHKHVQPSPPPSSPRCPEEARNGFDDGKEHRPKAPQPFHRAHQTWMAFVVSLVDFWYIPIISVRSASAYWTYWTYWFWFIPASSGNMATEVFLVYSIYIYIIIYIYISNASLQCHVGHDSVTLFLTLLHFVHQQE